MLDDSDTLKWIVVDMTVLVEVAYHKDSDVIVILYNCHLISLP